MELIRKSSSKREEFVRLVKAVSVDQVQCLRSVQHVEEEEPLIIGRDQ